MKLLIVEPFYAGSHKSWTDELIKLLPFETCLLSLPGRNWKWRMHGGAITLAQKFDELNFIPDAILVSDMLDLTIFQALTKSKTHNIKFYIYFHENQLTYPLRENSKDKKFNRDAHYGFINISSALSADKVFFNSKFHMNEFLDASRVFLSKHHDQKKSNTMELIQKKSFVLPLGFVWTKFDKYKENIKNKVPLIVWNHRLEYDKNPEAFFNLLLKLKDNNILFEVAILGENFRNAPIDLDIIKSKLKNEIIHFGYLDSFSEYVKMLWRADIIPVTSIQDFFGISIIEAVYCDTVPILPNRLAYLDHFSTEDFPEIYYENEEELFRMTKKCIADFNKQTPLYSKEVLKYDWNNLRQTYIDHLTV